ncbi:MAG TPA: 16S rRNA methyltransferase [Methanosarcinales archaeon]|nr:16S rRNA methyltransferase [Methanosarcinales archaeon]
MLSLILADSELEIVPKEIQGHPSVVKNAKNRNKKPSSLLLDANYHHSAIRKKYLEEVERRGRPDIAHLFALLALDSILNYEGRLKIYIHTRNNHVIYINPETRIPKAYPRFVGLIESLYINKVIPDKTNPLMRLEENKNLKQLLKEIESDKIITFSSNSKEEQINIKTYFQNFKEDEKITCIIGGFPSGDFLSPIEELSSEIISIYPSPLKTWTVLSEILVNYENAILRDNNVQKNAK